jgi:hypothetical protein
MVLHETIMFNVFVSFYKYAVRENPDWRDSLYEEGKNAIDEMGGIITFEREKCLKILTKALDEAQDTVLHPNAALGAGLSEGDL